MCSVLDDLLHPFFALQKAEEDERKAQIKEEKQKRKEEERKRRRARGIPEDEIEEEEEEEEEEETAQSDEQIDHGPCVTIRGFPSTTLDRFWMLMVISVSVIVYLRHCLKQFMH